MNPFVFPDRIFISAHPQDMRAGIQSLASRIVTDFSLDPHDGALYCFVSRDTTKMKMLRFDTSGWCLYYLRLARGSFRWVFGKGGLCPYLQFDRISLHLLLNEVGKTCIKPLSPLTKKLIL